MTTLLPGLPEQRKPIPPLTLADFSEDEDGERRVADWRLAEVLGFAREFEMHRLIERHRQSLERFGTLRYRDVKSTGGRPGTEYRLNFNQAIFIVIKSEAQNAIPVQIHVVEIYGLWAHGKLLPVDAETARTIADANERISEQAPELVQLLQDLLGRVGDLATHTDASDVGDRVASVQRTSLEIYDRLNDIVKRRPAPTRNQDVYDRVIEDFYLGRCPCCGRHVIIKDGARTALYCLDHATDNPYRNGLYEMWAVCKYCNSKFKHDPRYRAETMDRFRVFQSRVQEIMGQRLL
jgi:hypothetical protein